MKSITIFSFIILVNFYLTSCATTPAPINDFSKNNLLKICGKEITIEGYSVNRPDSAQIITASGSIGIPELPSWPKNQLHKKVKILGELISETGKKYHPTKGLEKYIFFDLVNFKILTVSSLDIKEADLRHGFLGIREGTLAEIATTNDLDKFRKALKKGANPNEKVGDMDILIFCFLYYKPISPEIISLLIEHGANPNSTYKNSNALNLTDNLDLIKLLLKHGTNPNHRGSRLWTPLMSQIISPNAKKAYQAVNLLLSNGANPNVTNDEGWTALDLAVDSKADKKIIDLLRKHGAKTGAELKAEKKE